MKDMKGMNRHIYNKVVRKVIMALPFYLFTFLPFTASAQKQLVVLHTNDTHSQIFPINVQLPDTLKAGRGGFLRRLNLLQLERQKDPELLLFDSGDFCQGSAYFTMFKGDVEVGLMNQMGYDAVTIGNHEFDFGMENMARIFKLAKFPIVCSNYDFTGTPCEGLVKPYVIIKRKGVKIGVFALSPKLKGLVSDKNCVGVKYLDPAKVALETATMLKTVQKCDVIVCLSHLGWNSNRGEDDQYFIPKSRYIDLVLGGHTHTFFDGLEYISDMDGKQVPVDQNGKSGCVIARMVMTIQSKK